MIAVPRLLSFLLSLLMASLLTVATADAHDKQAGVDASQIGVNSVLARIQRSIDHSSRVPRDRASLEEFFELDDDAEQFFEQPLALVGPLASSVPAFRPHFHYYRAHLSRQRPCAAYPTGPPHA